MTEPAKIILPAEHRRNVPAQVGEVASFMQVLERAVRDPSFDVDKLERLTAMIERSQDRARETAFAEALSDAQAEMSPVAADANNPQTRSRYASYMALDRACRPIYARHGFALSFGTEEGAPADMVRVVCHVSHREGHTRRYHIDMPADGKGAKGGDVMTKTHAVGAAMSYGQRYLLKLIFNIAVGDDDDGNSNGGRETSEAFKKAVATINGHRTPVEHALWKKEQAEGVQQMVSADEWREIVALWNRRAKALKEAAAQ